MIADTLLDSIGRVDAAALGFFSGLLLTLGLPLALRAFEDHAAVAFPGGPASPEPSAPPADADAAPELLAVVAFHENAALPGEWTAEEAVNFSRILDARGRDEFIGLGVIHFEIHEFERRGVQFLSFGGEGARSPRDRETPVEPDIVTLSGGGQRPMRLRIDRADLVSLFTRLRADEARQNAVFDHDLLAALLAISATRARAPEPAEARDDFAQ